MIDIKRINKELNDYAVDTLYNIVEKYGAVLTNNQIEQFDSLIVTNKVITVDCIHDFTLEKFNHNVPSACGPRTYGDGIIHLFPEKYENLSDDEIIERYKNEGIITHELFHYVIKLDEGLTDSEELEFAHFLNEGMVQFFTEAEYQQPLTSCEYRKNVDLAVKLYMALPDNHKKFVFSKNWKDLSYEVDLNIFFDEYKRIKNFQQKLDKFLLDIADKINMDPGRLIHRFRTLSIDDTITMIHKNIDEYLPGNDELHKEFDAIVESTLDQKEKKLA